MISKAPGPRVHYSAGRGLQLEGVTQVSGPMLATHVPADVLRLLNDPQKRVIRVIIEHHDLNDPAPSPDAGHYWVYTNPTP